MNKKILISLSVVGIVAALAIGITTAYFSNTEKSEGNSFIAGAIDLKVDSECTYNGVDVVSCRWLTPKDLAQGDLFFNFDDIKPGDYGEDTISLHVDTNPAWVCAEISGVTYAENGQTPPEAKVDTSIDVGELQDNLYFDVWIDDGVGTGYEKCNNIYNDGETKILTNAKLTDKKWPIADSVTGTKQPIRETCLGIAWHVPNSVGNEIQTDKVTADISFKAYQSRNNESFKCEGGDGCFDQADVMLVLDRSGSISGSETTNLKNAAKAFVVAMNPNGGVHMGQTSFATTGTTDRQLTGDQSLINAAIDGLVFDGLTNLYDGIRFADTELESTRDRDDTVTPDYMIVITDGRPNEPGSDSNARAKATDAATIAKNKGIKIYVVGVGSDVDSNYLRNNIASGPSYYYGIGDYNGLQTILQAIATCQQGTCQSQLNTLFSDGFDSGNFGAWDEQDNNWDITDRFYEGSYASYTFNYSNEDDLRKAINTSGYNNITLNYWYRVRYNLESGDHVYVQWSKDGTTWTNLADYTSITSSDNWTQASFNIPLASDSSTFQIRFRSSLNYNSYYDSDIFRLDSVSVTGYNICP